MADFEGLMDLIPWIWNLVMALTRYLAMCSLMVKMLPCPTAELGPKKAATVSKTRTQ